MNLNILHTFPQPVTIEVWQYVMIWVLILGITIFNMMIAINLADYIVNKFTNKKNKNKSVSTNDAISLSNLSDKE